MFSFFFNATATTEIYTLSLHDALPIYPGPDDLRVADRSNISAMVKRRGGSKPADSGCCCNRTDSAKVFCLALDRKSTRLNSSHANISYAVFCLKKKNNRTSI